MTRLVIVLTAAVLVASASQAADFEAATMTVPASSILEPGGQNDCIAPEATGKFIIGLVAG